MSCQKFWSAPPYGKPLTGREKGQAQGVNCPSCKHVFDIMGQASTSTSRQNVLAQDGQKCDSMGPFPQEEGEDSSSLLSVYPDRRDRPNNSSRISPRTTNHVPLPTLDSLLGESGESGSRLPVPPQAHGTKETDSLASPVHPRWTKKEDNITPSSCRCHHHAPHCCFLPCS